jgi:fatty-acyl-CoA synthase
VQPGPSRLELSPLNFLHRNAVALGERPAVVHGDRRLNYAELEERCNRLANALRERGLERHERVAILAPNTPALLEAHYAVPLAGGVLVAMNSRLSSGDIEYILKDAGCTTLLVDAELKKGLQGLDLQGIETVVIEDSGQSEDPYEQLVASGSPDAPESWLEDENEPISINYTSGTTGKAKGAVYTHRGAYLRALGVALEIRLSYDSVHLWTLPMFHCNGWCLTWGVTAAGGVHVCMRKVDPDLIWDLFDSEGITHYSGAPTVHMSIVNHDKAHPLEQRVIVPTGGSPPTPALLRRMKELNLHPIHLYGLTETYGPVMGCQLAAALGRA